MTDLSGFTLHSVSWVRTWMHMHTLLGERKVHLVGHQRQKIRQVSKIATNTAVKKIYELLELDPLQ